MRHHNGTFQLSATDLSNFLSCKHRTALDMAVAQGLRNRPVHSEDPLLDILIKRGLEHEHEYVAWLGEQGLKITDLSDIDSLERPDELVAATVQAMTDGAEVIVQGGLRSGAWFGKPDILRRVETTSDLGAWSYEVYDTKLSRKTKAGTILQLSLYSAMVSDVQGTSPERLFVVAPRMQLGKPAPEELSRDKTCPDSMMVLEYRVADYAAYFRLLKRRLEETVACDPSEVAAANYPEPVSHCTICRWDEACSAKRRTDDHLSLVAGLARGQRRELQRFGIDTRRKCAETWPLPATPTRGSLDTYENAHRQALLQVESEQKGTLLYELRPAIAARPATDTEPAQLDEGLCRLPAPSPGDMFLDFEGDPYSVEGGREYLTGVATEVDGAPNFDAFWGFNDRDERASFEQLMDMIVERRKKYPDMHVYHYAPYETTALRKLRLRYETRGAELDELLSAGVFVDLYAVVRQGLRVGSESYSIKALEPLYDFKRVVDLRQASICRNAIEVALQSGEMPTAEIIETVRGYNEDDCVSTLRLRDWLEEVRAAQPETIPRPTMVVPAEAKLNDHDIRVRALRPKLLDAIPDDPAHRSPEQQARWLLAYLLDYHRREALASFWEYYRLRELPEDELEDEPQAIAGMEFVERVDENRTKAGKLGAVTDRYRYPPQEMEIEDGTLNLREGSSFGDVVAVDRIERTIDVKKRKAHTEYHPRSVFAFKHIATKAQEDAIFGIASRVVEDGGLKVEADARDLAARRLLMAAPPVLSDGSLDAPKGDIVEHLVAAVARLDRSVLPVQGPPGAGKTHAGGEAIYALAKAGKRIGVAANSHAVVRHLLEGVVKAAHRHQDTIAVAHKCDPGAFGDATGPVAEVYGNDEARTALEEGTAQVVGGTSWLWAHPLLADSVDVLVVDEAGQMALANVLAMTPCAKSVILLGDPQQLEQPKKAAHPEGVDVSALSHLLAGRATVTPDRGVFLPVTWRMCPSITTYTSELFYEGRLSSLDGLDKQTITGVSGLAGAGLRLDFSAHEGNRSYSNEEVDAVASLVKTLTTSGTSWIDKNGVEHPIAGKDILVVAPYNAQVSRLVKALEGTGARAGTVDKFQGQEAPIVIYSMATSRPEDAPRGLEFLYSLNRLNVATSRARCVALIVGNQQLFEPECRTPRQMKLANALCRYSELSTINE